MIFGFSIGGSSSSNDGGSGAIISKSAAGRMSAPSGDVLHSGEEGGGVTSTEMSSEESDIIPG